MVEITRDVLDWLEPHGVQTGLLTLFCRHTSAGLLIQENAAPDVRADLETFFERLAPEEAGRYRHEDEGADDMPAHIRTALIGAQLSVPLMQGRLVFGNVAGDLSFRTSTGAAPARNRPTFDRRMRRDRRRKTEAAPI